MQKLCRYVLMVSTVTALLFQAVLSSVSFQDYVYRRATSGDLLAVLDIMSAIESSKAHKYIVLYYACAKNN